MNLPKIIKTRFFVDSNNRQYNFDVNQNISVNEVKGLLVVASKVPKIGLRIFHKQTEKEYTKYHEETLEELFPNMPEIEFIISIDKKMRNDPDQLKLGEQCHKHKNKYSMFYCFDCEESLCSVCVSQGNHFGHSVFEKFDYLKPSNEIVDNIFSDLDSVLKNVDSLTLVEVEELKIKLKTEYFPSLIALLKKIEEKLNEQLDTYIAHFETSVTTVKTNTIKLKETCTEGLNELKNRIDIESILKDEGVFLHFDYKVKEMGDQKSKIFEDNIKIDKIIKSFSYAKAKIETIYENIKAFLQKQLTSTLYEEIKQKWMDISVPELSKDPILAKILSDFKKKDGKVQVNSNSYVRKDKSLTGTNIDSTAFATTLNSGSKFADSVDHEYPTQRYENFVENKGDLTQISHSSSNLKEISSSLNDSALSKSNTYMEFENSRNLNTQKNCLHLMKVVEKDSKVTIYVDEPDSIVQEREVLFNPKIHGCTSFLPNCAITNTGSQIYISGGEISNGDSSNIFLTYQPISKTLIRLPDMPTPKHLHSLLFNNDFVYSVGGHNSNSCEMYDIKHKKWTKLQSLKSNERQLPTLYMNGTWLYAFFGSRKGGFIETIERINVRSQKSKWESVLFTNPEKLNLGITEMGIITGEEGVIYMLGGKDSKGIRNTILNFNFTNSTLASAEFNMEEGAFFKESSFIKLSDGEYALFNESVNQLLKLGFSN